MMNPHVARWRSFLAVLLALITCASARSEEWKPVWDHWYVMEFDDAPAGWMREQVLTDGETYRLLGTTRIAISRMGSPVRINIDSEFIESVRGEPIRMEASFQNIETKWEFGPDFIDVTETHGDRTHQSREPLPDKPWMTRMAAVRYWRERREAGADVIRLATLDPLGGLMPVVTEYSFLEDIEYTIGDRTIPATKWRARTESLPGEESDTLFSEEGHVLRDEFNLPFGRLTIRLVTEQEAKEAGEKPAPELMIQAFVEPVPPIRRPRDARTAVLRVSCREGELPELPSAGAQRVEAGEQANEAVLRIDANNPLPALSDELEEPTYRSASALVDSNDEMIAALARKASRGAEQGDDRHRAEAMREFVARYISAKGLDTAFASASETAKMRTGDCSEHAVLLCAMLRAEGIPARAATGLVCLEIMPDQNAVFGWHMWTQALIDGKWIDLDAAISNRYDAAHVLTGTSSLAAGEGFASFATVLRLFGNLSIETIEIGYE